MLRKFFNDEAGFVISAELVIILTLVVCATVIGIGAIRDSIVTELHDVSEAIGALNQSYNLVGLSHATGVPATPTHAVCSGGGYNDDTDACDCKCITLVVVAGKDDPSGTGVTDGTN